METTALQTERALKKWKPILEHPELGAITDPYRKSVTALLLENQQTAINEAAPYNAVVGGINNLANTTANGANSALAAFDPVMISLVRRAMPNLIAYDVCGVQPMTAPTGLIFCMKARYNNDAASNPSTSQTEALGLNAANTFYSGTGPGQTAGGGGAAYTQPYDPATGFLRTTAEAALATLIEDVDGVTGTSAYSGIPAKTSAFENPPSGFAEMGFSIERTSVIARSRALQASYSAEIAQDLKAVHGLDVETELANILTNEVLAEINREVVRTIYQVAKLGGVGLATAGSFDVQAESDGRWAAERFRGLMFQIEREANAISKETRRGKGNIIICSSDVASALSMSGLLEANQSGAFGKDIDDTGNTFVGTIGRFKVYIDPYAPAGTDFVVVGYKGTSQYDAGFFYCPYVPLQMVRAIDPTTFQPKIGFKTRYGIAANPFATTGSSVLNYDLGVQARTNTYYRIFRVTNLHGFDANA